MGSTQALLLLSSILIVSSCSCSSSESDRDGLKCRWEVEVKKKWYSFDLKAPQKGFPFGAHNADGFYKITQANPDGEMTTFWFQLCENMKFNHDAPKCFGCKACGGPEHCGETCSALKATHFTGFRVCECLGIISSSGFSLIDSENPGKGLVMNMSSHNEDETCSFTVSVLCDTSSEELLHVTTNGKCHHAVVLKHPSGCALVSLQGNGLGWFRILLILVLCLLAVYIIGGALYRWKLLGIHGLQAIPNLDLWCSLAVIIQLGFQRCIGCISGSYYRSTASYSRVN